MPERSASFRRIAVSVLTVLVSGACGGGSDKTTGPPQNNNPASVVLSQTGAVTLASGATATLTATVLTSDGRQLSGFSIAWASSDANVASVQNGVITASRVGIATITASTAGLTSMGLTVNVTPGAPAALAVRTQPGGAVVAVPLTIQPVVEVRDAAGNLVAGSTLAVTATIQTGGGTLSNGTVNAVGGVATFTGLTLVGRTGDRTLRFTSGTLGAATSGAFSLAVGAATSLAMRTQPGGAAVAAPFQSQPVVEIQDLGGNLVATASATVTVALASGGGLLTGLPVVNTISGVATFAGLTLTGTIGPRTLSFTAPSLTGVTTASFDLAPGAPAQMRLTTQPVGGAIGALLLTPPVLELRDISGNLATTATTPVTASVSFGGGVVTGGTVNSSNGSAAFANLIVLGSVGDRELTFSAPGVPPVTSSRFTLVAVLYGTAGQKIQILDAGGTTTPTLSAGMPPAFISRAPSRASVDIAGRITAQDEGQAWIVSSLPSGADSVLIIVTRTGAGPVLRASLSDLYAKANAPGIIDLTLDQRGTPVSTMSVFVTVFYETATFNGTVVALSAPGAGVVINEPTPNVFRFSIAVSPGNTAPVTFGRVQFTGGAAGTTMFVNITAIDGFSLDGFDLMPLITSTSFPVTFR
ncbi:MAG: hypothetical protein MNPFHGCM_02165 [Gemmatimonadaceae bacterium]|nr:hypothetical protein [Gemmatimonadaceae bacterium]